MISPGISGIFSTCQWARTRGIGHKRWRKSGAVSRNTAITKETGPQTPLQRGTLVLVVVWWVKGGMLFVNGKIRISSEIISKMLVAWLWVVDFLILVPLNTIVLLPATSLTICGAPPQFLWQHHDGCQLTSKIQGQDHKSVEAEHAEHHPEAGKQEALAMLPDLDLARPGLLLCWEAAWLVPPSPVSVSARRSAPVRALSAPCPLLPPAAPWSAPVRAPGPPAAGPASWGRSSPPPVRIFELRKVWRIRKRRLYRWPSFLPIIWSVHNI